jgi:chloramphenicol 3-O-phosphotransferase
MEVDVIVLNGGSSSGKSSLANSLQKRLVGTWLKLGIDDLIHALSHVVWVGVRCDPAVAESRELRRPDRTRGVAREQAERVHQGVSYDIVVDTSETSTAECATSIAASLGVPDLVGRPPTVRDAGN